MSMNLARIRAHLGGFVTSEDGLVTVEWVALAGALAIGAITVGWIVLNGLKTPANNIGNNLSSCWSTANSNSGSTSGC
ncbi:MAG: hypothetical protein KGJ78_14815 [Alphaproteobacteria bacterium]|nr:hypothetical protein [Alphaproteobacteria bacterium]